MTSGFESREAHQLFSLQEVIHKWQKPEEAVSVGQNRKTCT